MSNRYAVDRIVDGLAVLIPDNEGNTLYLDARKYGLCANDILDITMSDDGEPEITKNEEEKIRRLENSRIKLNSLFNKKKNG